MVAEQEYIVETLQASMTGRDGRGASLVLRHSIRESIEGTDMMAALTAPLTQEGKALAWNFGRMLAFGPSYGIRYSSAPRCEDTAHFMRRGMVEKKAQCVLLGRREFLEAPFVRDPVRVMEVFINEGNQAFARSWARSDLDSEVITPIEKAGRALLEDILREHRTEAEDTVSVFVTHDITMLALLHLFMDVSADGFPWPDQMGGAVLLVDERGPVLSYRGSAYRLSSDSRRYAEGIGTRTG